MLTSEERKRNVELGRQHAFDAIDNLEKKKQRPLTSKEKQEILDGWLWYFSIDWKTYDIANGYV